MCIRDSTLDDAVGKHYDLVDACSQCTDLR